MQTILGSGGSIGIPLARELIHYTDKIRLVSRHPKKVNEKDELFPADLTQKEQAHQAVAGSKVVYLTVGLPYNIKIWRQSWPVIMQNVIEACIDHQSKLVFFDNVYLYAPDEIPHMTEKSRIAPVTQKGKVRATLVKMIFDAIEKENLIALIARSADFYGLNTPGSFLESVVLNRLRKKQKAIWQSNAHKIHTLTYTPDAAKALALLGNTSDAYNQTWHLPTSSQKWTGQDFIHYCASEMGVKPRYFTLSKTMIGLMGIFTPLMRELKEMQYQNDQDYFFDSSKFETQFSMQPVSYENGIKEIIQQQKAEEKS